MIWYILIVLFILLLTWILFGPVIIKLNSDNRLCKVSLPGVISVRVMEGGSLYLIKIWLFFIPFTIDPMSMGKQMREKKEKPVKKKKSLKSFFQNRGMFKQLLRAIRIRNFRLDLDTDDFILNAWLIPALSMVNVHKNIQAQVNFEGNIFLNLDVRTRLSAILWLMIKNKIN